MEQLQLQQQQQQQQQQQGRNREQLAQLVLLEGQWGVQPSLLPVLVLLVLVQPLVLG
jgi:hypothetical protein